MRSHILSHTYTYLHMTTHIWIQTPHMMNHIWVTTIWLHIYDNMYMCQAYDPYQYMSTSIWSYTWYSYMIVRIWSYVCHIYDSTYDYTHMSAVDHHIRQPLVMLVCDIFFFVTHHEECGQLSHFWFLEDFSCFFWIGGKQNLVFI